MHLNPGGADPKWFAPLVFAPPEDEALPSRMRLATLQA